MAETKQKAANQHTKQPKLHETNDSVKKGLDYAKQKGTVFGKEINDLTRDELMGVFGLVSMELDDIQAALRRKMGRG